MAGKTLQKLTYMAGGLGVPVVRAAAADPQNSVMTTIFAITGGLVLVRLLVGRRTVIQAGGASNIRLQHSIGPTFLCAATATSATDAVGTTYTITGNPADGCLIGAAGAPTLGGIAGGLLATGNQGHGIFMSTGNIQVYFSAAAATGSTEWTLFFVPITTGAYILPA